MTHSPVGAHLDVTLNIHRDLLAEVAFDRAFLFEDVTDRVDFFFRQIRNLLVGIDICAVQQALRAGAADSVDISKADFRPLLRWEIDARNTCHISSFSLFCPAVTASLAAVYVWG